MIPARFQQKGTAYVYPQSSLLRQEFVAPALAAAVALGVGVAPVEASSSLSSFGGVNLPVPSANLPVAPAAAAKPVAPASSRVQNIINYTNDYRKAHGLRPVRANGALNGLAQD